MEGVHQPTFAPFGNAAYSVDSRLAYQFRTRHLSYDVKHCMGLEGCRYPRRRPVAGSRLAQARKAE